MHVYFIRDAMKAWTSRNGNAMALLLTGNDHKLHLAWEDRSFVLQAQIGRRVKVQQEPWVFFSLRVPLPRVPRAGPP